MNLSDTARLARAIARVLADSTRTEEIHLAEELTGQRRFIELRRTLFDSEEARTLLRDRPELCSAQVDYDARRRLPRESLGFQYVNHLDRYGLSADYQAAATTRVDDAEIAYLMRRFRQTHDLWHTLLGLGTAGYEEVIIHAFSWGQLRLPVSALVVLFGTVKHIVFEGRWVELRHGLWEASADGRDADSLLPVYWEQSWEEPIDTIRQRYRVTPCTRT